MSVDRKPTKHLPKNTSRSSFAVDFMTKFCGPLTLIGLPQTPFSLRSTQRTQYLPISSGDLVPRVAIPQTKLQALTQQLLQDT